MKHLKLYEEYIDNPDLDVIRNSSRWSSKFKINKLVLNEDGTYDYLGNLNLQRMKLKSLEEIPIRLNKVHGIFGCRHNQLRNFIGGPKIVTDNFNGSYNRYLESLEGSPEYVGGEYNIHNLDYKWRKIKGITIKDLTGISKGASSYKLDGCLIESLRGFTAKSVNTLNLENNELTDLKGIESLVSVDTLQLDWNNLFTLEGLENLRKVNILSANNNELKSLSVLSGVVELRKLSVYNNKLTDLKGLENIKEMYDLTVNSNKLTDFKELSNLTKINLLYCIDNELVSLKGLENLRSIVIFYCEGNNLTSFKEISNVKFIGNGYDSRLNCNDNLLVTINHLTGFEEAHNKYGYSNMDVRNNPFNDDSYSSSKFGDSYKLLEKSKQVVAKKFIKKVSEDNYKDYRDMILKEVEGADPEIYNILKTNYNLDSFLERQEKFGGQEEIDL